MNQVTADCASFFHERPAYRRILELLLRKYRSYGRPAGTICLPDATPEECDAVRGLFGRSFSPPLLIKTAEMCIRDRITRDCIFPSSGRCPITAAL